MALTGREMRPCCPQKAAVCKRGVKSPGLDNLIRLANALDVSADLLLGTAISTYNLTMLKDIEKRIQMLPASEQQKLLDIFDAVISVELNHNQSERPNKW